MSIATLSNRLDLPQSEIIRRANQHTLSVQAWLSSRSPQAKTFTTQGIRASSTGLQVPLLNLALGCDFPLETPDDVIDTEILTVKDFFVQRNVPWYWWIGAKPTPSNIGERLRLQGIMPRDSTLPAMVAPLDRSFESPDANITVWQAKTIDDLASASYIRRKAFRFPDDTALTYFDAMPESWIANDKSKLYLARVGDSPAVAMGALITREDIAGVYVMATLPEWGRRGLGKAILAQIMNDALAEGHQMIVLTASRFGFPLYQQFGFEHVFDYTIYVGTSS